MKSDDPAFDLDKAGLVYVTMAQACVQRALGVAWLWLSAGALIQFANLGLHFPQAHRLSSICFVISLAISSVAWPMYFVVRAQNKEKRLSWKPFA